MVTIRLSREGAKKRPFYQIVVATVVHLVTVASLNGFFNPIACTNVFRINLSVNHWVARCVSLSDRVMSLQRSTKAA